MAPTPVPTPYDITALPFFPFSPSWQHWLGAAAATCAVIGYFRYAELKRKNRRPALKAFVIAEQEIRSALVGENSKYVSREVLARISLTTRRLLSVTEGAEFSALTEGELSARAKSTLNGELRDLLSALVMIERLKFQPAPVMERDLAESLLLALSRYRHISEAKPA